MALLDELVSVGLAQWGGAENLEVIATKVPYPEWRSMFILAGLKPPRSFREVAERLQELLAARSQEKVLEWVEDFVEPSKVILVREPEGCSSEDRLGIRARANVMVSTLVLMGEGDSEDPRVVVDW